jgi:aspartyl-tRNA(Asn)/glutamyl-tRNA(Gln) amidotransferase subunit A
MAASVEDLVTAFRIITDDPVEVPAMFGRSRAPRIGICDAWWEPASVQVAGVVRGAVDRLREAGAVVESVDLPHIDSALPVGTATFCVEGASSHADDLERNEPISPSVRLALDMARGISASTYLRSQRIRQLIAQDFENALASVDVLISPTTCVTAPELHPDAFTDGEVDETRIQQLIHFTMPLNLTGLPAMQVPCGYDSSGLPIGMQIVARHGADLTTLSVATEVERHTVPQKPRVWFDLLQS